MAYGHFPLVTMFYLAYLISSVVWQERFGFPSVIHLPEKLTIYHGDEYSHFAMNKD